MCRLALCNGFVALAVINRTKSKQFIKCIEIDSLYLDAYYNLAFCYENLGNKNLACETWKKLKNMGQKQGEYLYEENCK